LDCHSAKVYNRAQLLICHGQRETSLSSTVVNIANHVTQSWVAPALIWTTAAYRQIPSSTFSGVLG